ncbi:hypothetical protein BayCH28_11710 [Mycolicibacterium sp. CH28]|uniref:hypothetical protein n=1 Tax=Mycolicibacterium sp. CH28 TaxID=2512237 RepID=UPI001080AC7B|nr:hypothetical protein [Mycolicibacterium sp. CH28]TGD88393.1 hypothetical protein BayCH28_11710 [Mycolicibacterium sp. CH28]
MTTRRRVSVAQSYVADAGELDRLAAEVGNGDDMTKLILFAVVLGDTVQEVVEMLKNPIASPAQQRLSRLPDVGETWRDQSARRGLLLPARPPPGGMDPRGHHEDCPPR